MTNPGAAPAPTADPGGVEQYRSYLYRYALLQLRDADRAEDAVQETLLAALENREQFGGKSQLKTWLTGILKHKIIDQIRRQSRERELATEPGDGDAADIGEFDALFAEDGHWNEPP